MARLSVEERVQILRLHKQGLPTHQIAKEMSRSWWTVKAVARPTVATQERLYSPGPGRLSMADREEIRAGIVAGETYTVVAKRLGRSVSTISRGVAKNGGRAHYRAYRAHRRAARCARRPKAAKLAGRPELRTTVEDWLAELWSPEQIANRLRLEHPGDPMMWVSHETIYQSLFVQGRDALKRELVKCLRTVVDDPETYPDVFHASGAPVTPNPGISYFDSVTAFEMIRSGQVQVVALGAYQVDAEGSVANWATPGMIGGGIGGAMDLVASGATVMVLIEHRDSQGRDS